jgi:hypothetical protein
MQTHNQSVKGFMGHACAVFYIEIGLSTLLGMICGVHQSRAAALTTHTCTKVED